MPSLTRLYTALALLAVVSTTVAVAPASAQTDTMTSPTIAVLDTQKVMEKSKAVQSIQEQIGQRRSEYQNQLSQKEQQLREENKKLEQQRSVLSAEAYQKKKKQLEKRIQNIQGDVQSQKKGLQKVYNRAMNEVKKELVEIVGNIAEERGIDLVVNKSAILLVRRQMEITGDALDALNSKLKTVNVGQFSGSGEQ